MKLVSLISFVSVLLTLSCLDVAGSLELAHKLMGREGQGRSSAQLTNDVQRIHGSLMRSWSQVGLLVRRSFAGSADTDMRVLAELTAKGMSLHREAGRYEQARDLGYKTHHCWAMAWSNPYTFSLARELAHVERLLGRTTESRFVADHYEGRNFPSGRPQPGQDREVDGGRLEVRTEYVLSLWTDGEPARALEAVDVALQCLPPGKSSELPAKVWALDLKARLVEDLRGPDAANPIYEEALTLARSLGATRENFASATPAQLLHSGWLSHAQGRYEEAGTLYGTALERANQVFGQATNPLKVSIRLRMAWIWRVNGQISRRPDMIQFALDQVLGIERDATNVWPDLHPAHAEIMRIRCELEMQLLRLDKAVITARREAALRGRLFPAVHPCNQEVRRHVGWVKSSSEAQAAGAVPNFQAVMSRRDKFYTGSARHSFLNMLTSQPLLTFGPMFPWGQK